jgi:ABC-type transport system involved in cytochrome c biogenesis ATPase subunit
MRIALARLLLSEPDLLLLDEVRCNLMTSFTCMLCVNHTCSACTGQGKSSDCYHRSIVLTSRTHNHC